MLTRPSLSSNQSDPICRGKANRINRGPPDRTSIMDQLMAALLRKSWIIDVSGCEIEINLNLPSPYLNFILNVALLPPSALLTLQYLSQAFVTKGPFLPSKRRFIRLMVTFLRWISASPHLF